MAPDVYEQAPREARGPFGTLYWYVIDPDGPGGQIAEKIVGWISGMGVPGPLEFAFQPNQLPPDAELVERLARDGVRWEPAELSWWDRLIS